MNVRAGISAYIVPPYSLPLWGHVVEVTAFVPPGTRVVLEGQGYRAVPGPARRGCATPSADS